MNHLDTANFMRTIRMIVGAILFPLVAMPVIFLEAQQPLRPGAGDSAVFRRAQQMIAAGNAASARALVDSVMGATREGTPMYVDALYWQAAFSDSPEAARKSYLRIVVEFALSARAEFAMLRLAQLEMSRGGKAAARRHLERLAVDHPEGATRAQGAYLLGRVLLDDGVVSRGCASLAEAKQRAGAGEVELQNQVSYALRACGSVQLAADSARADSVRADSLRADAARLAAAQADSLAKRRSARLTAKPPAAPKAAPPAAPPAVQPAAPPVAAPVAWPPAAVAATPPRDPPRAAVATPPAGKWTVQVAAYQVKTDANNLMAKLRARGLEARVTDDRPFRVRIGWYGTHADAVQMVEKLRAQQLTAIVMEAEKP